MRSHCGALMASLRALQGDKPGLPVLHRHAGCLGLADFVVPEGTGKGRLEIGKFATPPPWHPTQGSPQLGALLSTVKLRLPLPRQHQRCRSASPGAAEAFPPSQAGSTSCLLDELTGVTHRAGEGEQTPSAPVPALHSQPPALTAASLVWSQPGLC